MQIEELTRDTNIKLTNARKEILELFIDAPRPLSYRDVESNISMDKATFYRNIAIFEEQNIISSFESNDKKRYFEINQLPHGHFICRECNQVECLPSDINLSLEGYLVENIIIKGLCPQCHLG